MSDEERIIEIAQRAQLDPESLTEDEIQLLALAALSDEAGGDFLEAEIGNQN